MGIIRVRKGFCDNEGMKHLHLVAFADSKNTSMMLIKWSITLRSRDDIKRRTG